MLRVYQKNPHHPRSAHIAQPVIDHFNKPGPRARATALSGAVDVSRTAALRT